MRRLAAVDIGSNTVHALVADVEGGWLTEVAHHVEMPELGAEVRRTGRIGAAKAVEAIAALVGVVERARADGYEALAAGATAAVREAADGDEFLAAAGAAIGIRVHLIPEELEARLTFLGATTGGAPAGEWALADLGGSSTEIVIGRGRQMGEWASLRLGSGVLGATLGDPPAEAALASVAAEARLILQGAPSARPSALLATGGTASHLEGLLAQTAFRPADLERAESVLNRAGAQEIALRLGIPAPRVRALRAGVVILTEMLRHYEVPSLEVRHQGLRQGMILALDGAGDGWVRFRD